MIKNNKKVTKDRKKDRKTRHIVRARNWKKFKAEKKKKLK
jgi:hypothetical protein